MITAWAPLTCETKNGVLSFYPWAQPCNKWRSAPITTSRNHSPTHWLITGTGRTGSGWYRAIRVSANVRRGRGLGNWAVMAAGHFHKRTAQRPKIKRAGLLDSKCLWPAPSWLKKRSGKSIQWEGPISSVNTMCTWQPSLKAAGTLCLLKSTLHGKNLKA